MIKLIESKFYSQWDRSYKDNDTYAAPTSDRVERLGYTSGYGSVNVICYFFAF